MSYDLAVWYPSQLLSDKEAMEQYYKLCEGNTSDLVTHPAVDSLYKELSSLHPEVDDVPEEKIGDFDFSPWSNEHDRSNCHIIMNCVWSHADYDHNLVLELGKKHGLAVFDPQLSNIYYLNS